MEAVYHLQMWYEANRQLFNPPVCNKLMHKKQMTVMFVGGPNTRTDYHLDQGSEFFWMVKGNMELPTIQQGVLKVVKIREGEVFLLPSRVPHSPQRPEQGSLGLVLERARDEGASPPEVDGLRWYTDFENPTEILWEKFFHCGDLGRDLVPVVKAFHASAEKAAGRPSAQSVCTEEERPFVVDTTTAVPDPFSLDAWVAAHAEALASGASLDLFNADAAEAGARHPDKEFRVMVCGGAEGGTVSERATNKGDTWIYQLRGAASVSVDDADEINSQQLMEGCGGVVPAGKPYVVSRSAGSVGLVITNDPMGNK
jgi:3-hydroxyanthranilate 3,4-dioxygenase